MLSHKHLCLLDGQPELGNEAFAPIGKSMRLYKGGGGGGGGSVRYDNLDKLYEAQTEQAKLLGDVARDTVVPQYQALMADAQGMGGVAAQEQAAARVGSDYQLSAGNNRKMVDRNMAGMGVNVNDERYMRSMNGQASQDALAEVGLKNQERNRVKDLGFARRQDLVSMGLGLPSQSAAAYNNATNGMAQQQNQQQQFALQQQQANNSAISGAVSGGLAGYGLYKNGFADGGMVRRYAEGGVIRRDGSRAFAGGGFTGGAGVAGGAGFTKPLNAPMAPPPSGMPKIEPTSGQRALMGVGGAAQGAGFGKLAGNAVGDSVRGIGNLTGNQAMQQFGADIASGANNAGSIANTMVNKALGSEAAYAGADGAFAANGIGAPYMGGSGAAAATTAGAEGAAIAGGTAAAEGAAIAGGAAATGTAAAGGTAAATGAAAGGAGLTIGAAMPWIGGAMLADQALGLGITEEIGSWLGFADGGEVDQQRVNGLRGGEVDGAGGPTDDLIPAWLSDGEFVMTAEAVQHFGLDKLDKMNQVGLAIRNGSYGKGKNSKEKAA
jgi:hypothetical protein